MLPANPRKPVSLVTDHWDYYFLFFLSELLISKNMG